MHVENTTRRQREWVWEKEECLITYGAASFAIAPLKRSWCFWASFRSIARNASIPLFEEKLRHTPIIFRSMIGLRITRNIRSCHINTEERAVLSQYVQTVLATAPSSYNDTNLNVSKNPCSLIFLKMKVSKTLRPRSWRKLSMVINNCGLAPNSTYFLVKFVSRTSAVPNGYLLINWNQGETKSINALFYFLFHENSNGKIHTLHPCLIFFSGMVFSGNKYPHKILWCSLFILSTQFHSVFFVLFTME